ncbi:enoyl-CoA hydratase [Herbaspirillum sp. YR522]|uniref:enoyl-CoA hydratase n=1 Tax=Herbaspirillum sp. YR522 TaxID=1144342 RepID=UPI00026F9A6D|nr:enoyl-CoA hydratase [Herbaspirillum sp. YR522]EJM96082.1 enoyl-CoA hydratase/carnithine racemase [Herbaspirillum sp. YR522]
MDIELSKQDGILTIAFDREDKKNAITAAMYQQLADALKEAEQDAAVRAILFCGKPKVFTAGNDLEDFLRHPPSDKDAPVFQFLWQLSHAGKPIVAAVAGAAVGIGTTLLLHCDLVYAADNARFSMPFTQLGLCPEAASSLLLPHIAGYQRAAEKLLLGEPFDALEARDMGLVNRVLPGDELLPFARQQASKLAALPAASIRVTKQLMKKNRVSATEQQISAEVEHFARMLVAPEAKEAFTAFLEKRKPDFSQFA